MTGPLRLRLRRSFTGTIIDAVAATSPAPVTRDDAEPLDAKRE
jgi:hypothetical protein